MNQMHGSSHLSLAPTLAPLADRKTPRQVIDRLSGDGFRYVQLSATHPGLRPRELDQSARRDIQSTSRRREMVISGIDLWIPPEHFTQDSHVDRAVQAALDTLTLAGDLGRCAVSLSLPSPDDEHNDGFVQTLTQHAQHCGVTIADHALPIALRPPIGVGIDPAQWLSADEDPIRGVLDHAANLVVARLCDISREGQRGPVGRSSESQLDVTAYQATLSACGFRRPVVVDLRKWIEPWAGLQQTEEVWRAGFPA